MPKLKTTIWTVVIDSNCGTQIFTFPRRSAMDGFLIADLDERKKKHDADWIADCPEYGPDHGYADAMEHLDCETYLTIESSEIELELDATPALAMVRGLCSEVSNLQDQIHQMQGMFSDEDGNIQEALDGGDETVSKANKLVSEYNTQKPKTVEIPRDSLSGLTGYLTLGLHAGAYKNSTYGNRYAERLQKMLGAAEKGEL